MEQTKYFKDCVVIAQARVIEGKKTPPHICTIVWDLIDNNFIAAEDFWSQFEHISL